MSGQRCIRLVTQDLLPARRLRQLDQDACKGDRRGVVPREQEEHHLIGNLRVAEPVRDVLSVPGGQQQPEHVPTRRLRSLGAPL